MLRDMNISVNGRRDSTDSRVGVPASEIPRGFPVESFLLNDVDLSAPERLYRLDILTLPSAGSLYLDKAGVGSFSGAPVGTYTGTQRVRKYDPGVGMVSDAQGTYSITIAADVAKVTGVTISPTVAYGAVKFTGIVLGTNGPSQELTWTKNATAGTLSANGDFNPPEPASMPQVIVVRATSKADPTFYAEATVTIAAIALPDPPQIDRITITPTTANAAAGGVVHFDAVAEGSNNPPQEFAWEVDIGQVDDDGNVTAPGGTLAPQVGTVTVRSTFDSEKKASAVFIVASAVGNGSLGDFVPSAARTVRILPGRSAFAVGSHWTLGSAGPVGSKDPNSMIDIPFDWSAWLADIGDAGLSKVEFLLGGGLQNEGMVPNLSGGTVVVSGGAPGTSATVTCRITTASTPARTEDRTVVLQIKDQ